MFRRGPQASAGIARHSGDIDHLACGRCLWYWFEFDGVYASGLVDVVFPWSDHNEMHCLSAEIAH